MFEHNFKENEGKYKGENLAIAETLLVLRRHITHASLAGPSLHNINACIAVY